MSSLQRVWTGWTRAFGVLLIVQSTPVLSANAADTLTRDALVALLRHRESLVRTLECRFASSRTATTAQMVRLPRQLYPKEGRGSDYERFLTTPEMARLHNYEVHWWRRAVQERTEKLAVSATNGSGRHVGESSVTNVFNGEVVRNLARGEEGVFGSIEPPSRWYSVHQTHPMSLLYKYQNTPYSDLIARSPTCEVSAIQRGGRSYTRVYFHHPTFYSSDSSSFVLLFDENDLLLERDCIVKLSQDREPRVYEEHTFSDYRKYADSSGEQIWFPNHAVYHYYAGDLSDGAHVEYMSDDITITDIKFNVPIPDDKFVLEFPKDARVYDEASGVGWLDEAAKRAKSAAELTHPMSPTRWALIICSALLAVLITVFVWRRRRRMRHA